MPTRQTAPLLPTTLLPTRLLRALLLLTTFLTTPPLTTTLVELAATPAAVRSLALSFSGLDIL